MIGLNIIRHGTGNIAVADLGGEKISNGRARDIVRALGYCKCWVDYASGELCTSKTGGWQREILGGALKRLFMGKKTFLR